MCDRKVRRKYDFLAVQAGLNGADELIRFLNQMLIDGGISGKHDELKGLLLDHLKDEDMVKNIMDDRGGKGNPIPLTRDYIGQLFRSL